MIAVYCLCIITVANACKMSFLYSFVSNTVLLTPLVQLVFELPQDMTFENNDLRSVFKFA